VDEKLDRYHGTDDYYTHAASGGIRKPETVAGPLMTLHKSQPLSLLASYVRRAGRPKTTLADMQRAHRWIRRGSHHQLGF